jgi:hypothetical protein
MAVIQIDKPKSSNAATVLYVSDLHTPALSKAGRNNLYMQRATKVTNQDEENPPNRSTRRLEQLHDRRL